MEYERPYEYGLRMADKELSTASHLIYVTYPAVEEIKLLLPIAEHITKAAKLALQALLEYELAYKYIDVYPNSLQSQIDVFESNVLERRNFDKTHLLLLKKLNRITDAAKASVIGFKRDDRYYFVSDLVFHRDLASHVDTESIGVDDVKSYLKFTKSFIDKIQKIIKS